MKQAVSWTRNDEITYYPKPLQAYITTLFVGTIQRKAQPQQTNSRQSDYMCRGTKLTTNDPQKSLNYSNVRLELSTNFAIVRSALMVRSNLTQIQQIN